MKLTWTTTTPLLALFLLTGCGDATTTETTQSETDSPAVQVDGSKFVLTAEPESAGDVIAVREESKDGDDIVIVGRIGGSPFPWIKDRAAFTIADRSLKPCNEIPGDTCELPWDYCCQTDLLPTGTALVKFNDEDGKLIGAGAKELFKLKELDTVVIAGKAKRDDAGNLTVLASGMFVRDGK